ncbi:MAG: hypothetical protein NZL92_01180 [Gloeomargarita sp. SKYG116]|nr:hypothetical protein [Gloeomargarita sp. SKYG116]MDW8400291.1 hypothetical protein [Gloeomargarita sp. SKYGB_i_bin116]
MLAQLVRPLVRSQIQLLTQAQSAGTKLVGMVSQWLSYLGVQAHVTELSTCGEHIQVSLRVGRPELCTEAEWRTILNNLQNSPPTPAATPVMTELELTPAQQSRVQRILAHVIRAGQPQALEQWPTLAPQLQRLGLSDDMIAGIHAALKVPTDLNDLMEHLEPELSAFILSKAIGLALLDQRITRDENAALKALYQAVEKQVSCN